jgi:type VI protein secretion system component VasK
MPASPVRSAVVQLVVGIVALDAVFIGVHYLAGMRTAPQATRLVFTGIWTALTLVVVLVGLARVRRARGGPR